MSVEKLVSAAKTEDWDTIDEILPNVCDDPDYVNWAIENGLPDKDGNVRDLAVSILEKTHDSKFGGVKPQLRELMKNDKNPYVGYRAAFALYGHGDRSDEVVQVLKDALKDKDVAEIAERYLKEGK